MRCPTFFSPCVFAWWPAFLPRWQVEQLCAAGQFEAALRLCEREGEEEGSEGEQNQLTEAQVDHVRVR